ncbi:DNA polymerase epsilon subunit 3 isoform X2 [Anabrus simplex]|uniref:DNA polymerase epsilon subunit 3 isoform X2 n=1 Tax=Anabrus simplex TaxID=316456 RepID=UPI0035A38EC1
MLVKTEICFQFLKPRHGVHPRASSTIRRGGNHWRPGRTVIAKPSSTSIMAERLEDLSLPNTVVTRLAKETLPDGVNVAKEARTAIGKAASVFVLYLTAASSSIAIKNNRKTINGQDVLKAIEETELNKFLEPLEEALGSHCLVLTAQHENKKHSGFTPYRVAVYEISFRIHSRG